CFHRRTAFFGARRAHPAGSWEKLSMKWIPRPQNKGMLLLAIWLIATGAAPFVHLGSLNTGPILAVLAIVAGAFILLRREQLATTLLAIARQSDLLRLRLGPRPNV